jgi:hypothetical protein
MPFWLPFALFLVLIALSILLVDALGMGASIGIFGAGVIVFVLGLVWSERSPGKSPSRYTVHFGLRTRAHQQVARLIDRSGDPSLCLLRPAPTSPWGWQGLQLAEPRLVETLARGTGLLELSEQDRGRLARTIEWLSTGPDAELLTFELTGDNDDPNEIEIRASDLAGMVAAGKAATDVRYVVTGTR